MRALALGVIAASVALLADAAAEGDGPTAIDRPILSWLIGHRTAPMTFVFKAVTQAGSTFVMAVVAVVAVVVLLWRRRRADAVFLAVVGIGTGLLVSVGKPLVGRARPPLAQRLVVETNQSFPSGHALASIAIVGALLILFLPQLRSPGRRAGVLGVAVAFVAAVGVSRLYLGVHWPTDVLGGWLAGAGWLLVCVTARQFRERRVGVPAVSGAGSAVDQ